MKYKNKGMIIPFVIVFGGILALILVSLLGYVSYRYQIAVRHTASSNALQSAEAGLDYYNWYIMHTLEGKSSAQNEIYWQGNPLGIPYYDGQVKDQAGNVIGGYRLEVTPPLSSSTIINTTITGWDAKHPTVKRAVKARFRKVAWSEFAVVGNDIMRFGAGTEVWGPIHSNNGIHFDGVAHNLVSSNIADTYWDPDYGEDKPGVWTALPNESQVFLAGKEYPADYKDFNKIGVDFGVMKTAAIDGGGLYLGPLNNPYCGYHIVLRTDGKVNVYRVKACGSVSYQASNEVGPTVYNMPTNGVIFVEEKVWVEGTIRDQHLTIAAANLLGGEPADIYLFHNIKYTYYDGRDILGLVAQNNVTIGLRSDNNLEIDAALVAQYGKVGRDYYNQSSSNQYYNRDKITIYGCIVSNRRYGFAWNCGGNHCSGYRERDIIYDNNLLYYPPVFFPTEDHYSVDLWEEEQH